VHLRDHRLEQLPEREPVADARARELIRPVLEVLVGYPTVVRAP
jgi:hypothetical protein